MYNLALTLKALKKFEEAESMYREVLEGQCRSLGEGHLSTLRTMNNLGLLLKDRGKLDEAVEILEKGLLLAQGALPRGHRLIAFFQMNCGTCLMGLERYLEGADHLEEGYQEFKTFLGEDHVYTRGAIELLVDLYEAWNKPEKAEEWRTRLR
jgi:tetratricopeptide (TPR) repeat protein